MLPSCKQSDIEPLESLLPRNIHLTSKFRILSKDMK